MHAQQWRRHVRPARTIAAVCCAAAFALVTVACSSNSASTGPGNATPSGGTKIQGGTATWAELPSAPPNYIFPFVSGTYSSTANISEFQYLMYRPLYWFGNGASPTLNTSLSLAEAPVRMKSFDFPERYGLRALGQVRGRPTRSSCATLATSASRLSPSLDAMGTSAAR
jgi:hypothetical protein